MWRSIENIAVRVAKREIQNLYRRTMRLLIATGLIEFVGENELHFFSAHAEETSEFCLLPIAIPDSLRQAWFLKNIGAHNKPFHGFLKYTLSYECISQKRRLIKNWIDTV